MIFNSIKQIARPATVQNAVTVQSLSSMGIPATMAGCPSADVARKLSAVDACIEIISNSISKLPDFVIDTERNRVTHPVLELLNTRPNEAMTPSVRRKLLEMSKLETGNAYDWIIRDPVSMAPVELIPIPGNLVTPWRDTGGQIWYTVTNPKTGAPLVLPNEDICHYKESSRNGLVGISVLRRASEVIAAGRAAQAYDRSYYENGGQPIGVLQTETDLGGPVQDPNNPGKTIDRKEIMQREWERAHSGPSNAHRIAILDAGLTYKPLGTTNKDAQFVENKEISVKDIARFFGVPLYKLQEGKQAYGSNEQNAVEYVQGTLQPRVVQAEEEKTWKLLMSHEIRAGLQIRTNMMAELRGDTNARGSWYKNMTEIGAFSVDDVLALEDMPAVEGGEERRASLNYVPLSQWARLSENRNGGKEK